MTDSEILNRLHKEHRDHTINQFSINAESRELLKRMVDENLEIAGFRAKRSASTLFKLIPAESGNGADSAKNEAHKRPTSDSLDAPKVETPRNSVNSDLLPGLVSTSTPPLTTPTLKDKASQNLTRWRYAELTAEDWINELDKGNTIAPGAFKPDSRGIYRHEKPLWQWTRLVCCDADRVGTGEPVEMFTAPETLFDLYPNLDADAYAIGHSISSLWDEKPPPHVRARISFLLAAPVAIDKYEDFLSGLSILYPIISPGRAPSQPVFGNASKHRVWENDHIVELNTTFKHTICGNTLSGVRINEIADLGRGQRQTTSPRADRPDTYTGTQTELTKWLAEHNIPVLAVKAGPAHSGQSTAMYLVTCPWESEHTTDFGDKDTAVFVDPESGKYCFNCFHAHCEGRGWEDYRAEVAPKQARQAKNKSLLPSFKPAFTKSLLPKF